MDLTGLDTAYRQLLAAADATARVRLPASARDTVEWTLCHIALSDRILAAAARDVRAGLPTVVDNRDAMDADAIAALIAATSHAERVHLVRSNAAELLAALRAIPEDSARAIIRLRLVDRAGNAIPDQQLPWSKLIQLRAIEHVPGHAARLRALAGQGGITR